MDESNRECRDVLCCLLFVANVIAMIYVTIHAYTQGDTDRIYRGVDSKGNICGKKDTDTEDLPYVYFFNPSDVYLYRICVDECPGIESDESVTKVKFWDGSATSTMTWTCEYKEDGETTTGTCNWETAASDTNYVGYKSSVTLDRLCVPDSKVLSNAFNDYLEDMTGALSKGEFSNFVTDVKNVLFASHRTGSGCCFRSCSPSSSLWSSCSCSVASSAASSGAPSC